MLRKICLLLLLVASYAGYATHLRSGEISYQPVAGYPNTYIITFTIYTNMSPGIVADLNTLPVSFGDGTTATLDRQNGPPGYNNAAKPVWCAALGELVTPIIKKNIFSVTHTFSPNRSYIISTAPSARNNGILNISGSGSIPLYVESMLTVGNGLTPISSPVLSLPPIGDGCINSTYKINPGAIDPDGDELRFQLVRCKTTNGVDIGSYKYPNELDPTGNTIFKMDPRSGVITWSKPTLQGEYNISFMIQKYRGGVMIGYVLRDMQVTIAPCANHPPSLDPIPDFCVEAGTPITYKVTSTDEDGDTLTFTTTGMPYDVTVSPATYTPEGTNIGSTTGTFKWNTNAVHFRKTPYQVYYKVTDQHMGSSLSDVVSNFISLIAPSVKNVKATVFQRGFKVVWDKTICTQAVGYNIYRKQGPSNIPFDSCMIGMPIGSGYTLAGTVKDLNTLSFIDMDKGGGLPSGYSYCYVVTAYFDGGAETSPSEESCALLMYPFIQVVKDTLTNCQWSTIPIDSNTIKFINADPKTIYEWSSTSDLQILQPNQQVVSVKLLTTGLHKLKVVATSGLYVDSAYIYIQVNPIPSPKIKLTDLGGWPDSVMYYNRSINAVRTDWLMSDGTRSTKMDSVLVTYATNGYYRTYLKVYNSLGCPDTTSILYRVVMKGVAMPNAFEPENPSPKLNTFRPLALGLQTYFLGIWDLWGNLVWSSDKLSDTSPAEGWNGTDSKGRKLPSQNYIWRMKATFLDGSDWKGIKDHFGKYHKEGTLDLLR